EHVAARTAGGARLLRGVGVGGEHAEPYWAGRQGTRPCTLAGTMKKALRERIQRGRRAVGDEGGAYLLADRRAEQLHRDTVEQKLARLFIRGKREVARKARGDEVEPPARLA